MAAMLEAAGISAGGFRGVLRTKGLSAVYLSALRTWFRDETADKSKTMAALDKALGRADRLASRLPSPREAQRGIMISVNFQLANSSYIALQHFP